jgi:acyl carrier protein
VIKLDPDSVSAEVSAVVLRPVRVSESLLKSALLDSMALIDLAVALEKRFALRIPNGDLNADNFESVERITSYLERRRVA